MSDLSYLLFFLPLEVLFLRCCPTINPGLGCAGGILLAYLIVKLKEGRLNCGFVIRLMLDPPLQCELEMVG